MRRLFLCILTLMLFLPSLSQACPSFLFIDPYIEFEPLYDDIPTNLDLEYYNHTIIREYWPEIDVDEFAIDDSYMLYLERKYRYVEFMFSNLYRKSQTVLLLLINEDEEVFLKEGIITSLGTIIVDLSDIPIETTLMYVLHAPA